MLEVAHGAVGEPPAVPPQDLVVPAPVFLGDVLPGREGLARMSSDVTIRNPWAVKIAGQSVTSSAAEW